MCSKRKLNFSLENDDQLENSPECAAQRIKQPLILKDINAPKDNERSILKDSKLPYRRNIFSKFEKTWQELKKSGTCSSQPNPSTDTSFSTCSQLLNTSWPGTKRRSAKALSIAIHNSPRTPPLIPNKQIRPISSFQATWNALVSQSPPNKFSSTDLSEDSYIESSPVTQLVPDESPRQYLSSSHKKANPKQSLRFVRGGYANELRQILANERMDQRHLNIMKATHTGQVLAISEESNLSIALVAPETGPNFNILLQRDQKSLIEVGSRLKFYLDPNIRPLQLKNQQLVYCRPYNVSVL
ncbi:uncharacterized protein LOC108100993 [Drosophila ficusphila]|uniref:uncharacterized protein LOC108100993 n=1 Tax=Drosophila ficusphila TaxID=30025 RepID=UPI0007E82472|nr:uncharacterized protein LOC108100993 [Drosophila ficusphila]